VKLRLPDALHARPANLLVKVASRFSGAIEIVHGEKRANAKKILDVLALAAAKGAEVEVLTRGEDAAEALEAIVRLIERNFDQDLVPELGASAVEGVAIGHALVPLPPGGERGGERTRTLNDALNIVEADLHALVQSLPGAEAALFEPELEILHNLRPILDQHVSEGSSPEAAIRAATANATTDLLIDARVRLLDALGGDASDLAALVASFPHQGDLILITEELTPSLIARLPKRVVGVIAASSEEDGARGLYTSHAALLARGRGLPLVFAPAHVALSITDELVIIDTTEEVARIWVAPGEALLAEAQTRQRARAQAKAENEARASGPLAQLGVTLRANIGSIEEELPPAADGIGLVRTELVFAASRSAPAETTQFEAFSALSRKARGAPVVARLFDAGGDKPLPWLPPPEDDLDARGTALLLHHVEILKTQLAALGLAARSMDVRALLPLVRDASDVEAVRRHSPAGLKIGAMIETPEAVAKIDAIAAVSDFLSIGTNDLTACVLGASRERGAMLPDARVFALVKRTIERGHAAGLKVTICGEFAGDPEGARIFIGLGADGLSVAPSRLTALWLSLSSASQGACRAAAEAALQ
jgi:phosphotransferase system HPr (HPr) family protein